jgi:multiple sugar transport system permease protein
MAVQAKKVVVQSKPAIMSSWADNEILVATIFILPSFLGFLLFYAIPAVRGVFISFTDWNLLSDPSYVGFDNFQTLVKDEEFWNSLKVTIQYVLWNIPIQTMVGIAIAVMMDRLTRSVVVRGIILMPWLMANVVVGLLWLWLLDPSLGIVNAFLEFTGIGAQPFLGSPGQAIASIAGINIWRHVGYTAILIFAGLQTIPREVYEAGSIDGASEWNMFWKITLPLLRPVLVFVLITSIIGSFQIFDTVAVTTKGGPANATEVITWLIYEQGFERFDMGYATTIAIALFLILIVVSLVQLRIMRADESDI